MTRKDYVLIAQTINDSWVKSSSVHVLVLALTDALAQDNPRFDRERFLKACGVQS